MIISLDLPLPEFEAEWRMQIYEAFKKSNQKLYFLRMDSHDVKTLEKVKEIIGEEKLEFLLIDGDHTYEGAKKDYQMYSLLVKQEGLIAFHDIVAPPYRVASCEVNRLWNELKQESNYKEFVKSPKQRWAGIGVIIK